MPDQEMPAGLPPLPPVPDGFDRLEYRGEAWETSDPIAHFLTAFIGDPGWLVGDRLSTVRPSGCRRLHYLEAVPAVPVAAENTHCQNGAGDICLLARSTGVRCPEDSCDIDDGICDEPGAAPGEGVAFAREVVATLNDPEREARLNALLDGQPASGSETPETDAFIANIDEGVSDFRAYAKTRDFARFLERSRNEALRRAEALESALAEAGRDFVRVWNEADGSETPEANRVEVRHVAETAKDKIKAALAPGTTKETEQ